MPGDPILLYDGPLHGETKHFWTSYIKGAARCQTVLFMASQAIERGWLLEHLSPSLHASLLVVKARRAVMTTDAESVALENATLSARGAIRRPHCVITWLGKLRQLQCKGLSPERVLKDWNSKCTNEARVTGGKRVALLQLLHFPVKVQEQLLDHASRFGEQGAFLEDAWCNKKLAVGFTPRTADREWNTRLSVTEESLSLMVSYCHHQHLRKIASTRSKLGKEACEEALAMSSLLLSLNEDLKQSMAVPPAILDEKVVQKFLQGDSNFELELQAALSEKKKGFAHGDIHLYKELAKEHLAASSSKMSALGMSSSTVTLAAAQLEKQEFELCLQNLRHDLDVYKVWFGRSHKTVRQPCTMPTFSISSSERPKQKRSPSSS